MPDPILYSRPLCVGARDPDVGEITQNKSQPGPKSGKIIDQEEREKEGDLASKIFQSLGDLVLRTRRPHLLPFPPSPE